MKSGSLFLFVAIFLYSGLVSASGADLEITIVDPIDDGAVSITLGETEIEVKNIKKEEGPKEKAEKIKKKLVEAGFKDENIVIKENGQWTLTIKNLEDGTKGKFEDSGTEDDDRLSEAVRGRGCRKAAAALEALHARTWPLGWALACDCWFGESDAPEVDRAWN